MSEKNKVQPDSLKAMKPDTTAPEDDGELDNDDISDGEGGTSAFMDKGIGLGSENDDHFNADNCLTKRAKNNSRERERKEKIKNDMMELKSLLPSEMQSDKKQTHHDLLQLAISYIRSLLYQSNSMKLNQVNASSNQNTQCTDLQSQKEIDDLRLELAKYKTFINNAGLPQGIDLSQIFINWRFKTSEELLYNPNVNVDINLPVFQQQQQAQQPFFSQQQQPQHQSFNQFQSQGLFQNISNNQQAITQFSAMANQGHPAHQIQQQVAFNQNIQQISFAQQSFSLTQHSSEFQQQHQFQQQMGFVQQNIQTSYETDSMPGICTPSVAEGVQPGSEAPNADISADPGQSSFQDFLAAPEVQEFSISTAAETTQTISNMGINSSSSSGIVTSGDSIGIKDGSVLTVEDNLSTSNETNDTKCISNIVTSDGVSTSFSEDHNVLTNNSLSGLLTSNEICTTDNSTASLSSEATYVSFKTSDSFLHEQQPQSQQQQINVSSFDDGQVKSTTSFNNGSEGSNYISDCHGEESFRSLPGVGEIQQQFQQTQQAMSQPFHFASNGELMTDTSAATMSLTAGNSNDTSSQQQQTMQGSLIFQNGQLILLNNNNNLSGNGNILNNTNGNSQQNFFMQPQQQHNVLTQQNGFLGSVGQGGNMTIQTDHNQLLGQQQGTTQFIGPNGSINILTGHGLQANVTPANGPVFQNQMGILNPMNVLGGPMAQSFNQTLTVNQPQAQMMMPPKATDQPQALILPDGQIIPVVTQPNLLFPSQQCIPVTGSLLVPSVGATQARACGLPNILSAKPQPLSSLGGQRTKKKNHQSMPVQNVTLPPSMTAVLTPEGNVILSFPNASAGQNMQADNKGISSGLGTKSGQRPLMPKPSGIIQQPQQNFFETKVFASPQTPYFQNVLNIQQGANQPLSVMPLIQHSQMVQQMSAVSNVAPEMLDQANRGIECISPAGPVSNGDLVLQNQDAVLALQPSNMTGGCNVTLASTVTASHSTSNGFQTLTNVNEVTTSTGCVDHTITAEVKKKVKKKKKKKPSVVPAPNLILAGDAIQDNGIIISTRSGSEFSCMPEKEVDITDFSDLIRMEPMTPRPPDTSGRLTPTNQLGRTPMMNTPLMTSQSQAKEMQNPSNDSISKDLEESKTSNKSESLNIQREVLEDVVNCTLGDMVSADLPDSLLGIDSQKKLLTGIISSASHTFPVVTISTSLVSLASLTTPAFSLPRLGPHVTSGSEASSTACVNYSLSNLSCSLVGSSVVSTCVDIPTYDSLGGKSNRKKVNKHPRKGLNYGGTCQTNSPLDSCVDSASLSTHVIHELSQAVIPETHTSITTTSSLSSQIPISSVIPVTHEDAKNTKSKRRSRAKFNQNQLQNVTETCQPKTTEVFESNLTTPISSTNCQTPGRRTRSQSRSQELKDYQYTAETLLADISNESKVVTTNSDNVSPLASKKKSNKTDTMTKSALKVPLTKSSPVICPNSRQLVVSVEKLDTGQNGNVAFTSSIAPQKNERFLHDELPSKIESPKGQGGISSNDSCNPAAATTEEGTQTLRSELKSKIKQERRAKKMEEKKKKNQHSHFKDSKILKSVPSSHETGQTIVDDSVQLDLELFNLVDQVEKNMAASTQTEPKCRRGQKTKLSSKDDDIEDVKRLKIDESSQSSRGKDSSLTMKLKRVDNQSNFIVESPIEFNLGSPDPSQNIGKPNSPDVLFPKMNIESVVPLMQEKATDANPQIESGSSSFYGSRYLPNGSASSALDNERTLSGLEGCSQNIVPYDEIKSTNTNKSYYVLKQPDLSHSPEECGFDLEICGKKSSKAGDIDNASIEEKSKVGHTILQSLAKNLVAPSKQVSTKMAAQMARLRADEVPENENRPKGKNEKRASKRMKVDINERPSSKEKACDKDNEMSQINVAHANSQDASQSRNINQAQQQESSPSCYDLSMANQKLNDLSSDKRSLENEHGLTKPLSQCMGQENVHKACSQERQIMASCALTADASKTSENQCKPLPSCRQDKDKKPKDLDALCGNSIDQVDCSFQTGQSKPIGSSLIHREEYQMTKQQDDTCQSSRRRSRHEDEDKRSNSVGYHQANVYSSNSAQGNHPGHSYYKNDQAFAGAHHPYYMPTYFDVLHAPSTRFNPGLHGLPFEPSTPLHFFRDCASVFPAFQSPSGSFGADLSYQRGMNSSAKEVVDIRRNVESSHSNRNSLESNGRGSHQQQQNSSTSTLPSCKSAMGSNYLDNQQHQTHSTDKPSMPKQPSSAKKSSKTSLANYESSGVFDASNPFFSLSGLSPNKSHHPAHLSSPYFGSPSFFQDATRNISKGATPSSGSRTLHHRGLEDGFNKTSPSASSSLGLDFPSQDFSNTRNSMTQQQNRMNSFIGNSMPAHHPSFGFGSFFSDSHQMGSSLSHRGGQPSASNYYNGYNQQQAMGSNGLSRNGSISRGSSHVFNPEMAFNQLWGHQQAAFDPTRAISNPFSPNPFST